jgi:hypothetical protein
MMKFLLLIFMSLSAHAAMIHCDEVNSPGGDYHNYQSGITEKVTATCQFRDKNSKYHREYIYMSLLGKGLGLRGVGDANNNGGDQIIIYCPKMNFELLTAQKFKGGKVSSGFFFGYTHAIMEGEHAGFCILSGIGIKTFGAGVAFFEATFKD